MAKANKKEIATSSENINEGIPSGMKASDLSVEKRVELYQKVFEKFKAETSEMFGLAIGVEIAWTPNAAVPRMVLVDLLKKKDGQENTKQE